MKGVPFEKGPFEKRAAEKRRSREADERSLRSGKNSREQLRMKNGLFSGVKVRVEFDQDEDPLLSARLVSSTRA
jgi:hypothetical protein